MKHKFILFSPWLLKSPVKEPYSTYQKGPDLRIWGFRVQALECRV